MEGSVLYKLLENIDYEQLPVLWKVTDFNRFSENKYLYPYQREALINATIILYKYYRTILTDTEQLKKDFLLLVEHNGLDKEEQDRYFSYINQDSFAYELLSDYFSEDNGTLPAWHFINRMSFWMATGSGKSLILIKLIELLNNLMKYNLLPQNDILFLSHRPDLIDQLKEHISDFNLFMKKEKGIEFIVRDLRDFPDQKFNGNLFKDTQINIYYYRSDLISDIQKENIIDFRNYDNNGNWNIILDEAHKGDSEESKRKQYYNILSRNGFMFNFSATFTDKIDTLFTVYNLNLAEYIKKGFGKHLYLFQEQFKNFKINQETNDFEEEEKQKIVLMSLIMLTFIKKKATIFHKNVTIKSYHNPLLLTLVNSVNATDSDLYLFFNELEKIATNKLSHKLFENAKKTLQEDLYANQIVEFEKEEVLSDIEIKSLIDISVNDVLKFVFNTSSFGVFEVRRNPKNNQELSFRIKSGANSEPFALIKIGDVKEFEKNNLTKYNIEEDYDNVSIFENIDESSVNILMGSRAFYEGWDSNRPNIINFVNIGVQADAKKFILQSIGRGIRIEPTINNRKRLLPLINDGVINDENLKNKSKQVKPLETLFVFGTNQKAILSVLETLKGDQSEEEHQLSLFEKENTSNPLYIPVYKKVFENNQKRLAKLKIHKDDFALFDDIINSMEKTVMALNYNLDYNDVAILTGKFSNKSNFNEITDGKIGKAAPVIKNILNYYKIVPENVDTFKIVKEEIIHYNHIKVKTSSKGSDTSIEFKRLEELKIKIEKAKSPVDIEKEKTKLKKKYANNLDAMMEKFAELKNNSSTGTEIFSHRSDEIEIKKILNHYYFPSIISTHERIKWMKHIVDTPSEVLFLNTLEQQIKGKDNFFDKYDWWMFSKIDHTLDKQIRIPYIDPYNGKRDFLPDFVFWMQKNDNYHILYIDPKGTGRNEYQYKVDGYRDLFEKDGKAIKFTFDKKHITVHLRLVTEDTSIFADKDYYKKYWIEPNNFEINLID
jgi:hypothetical protein